MKRHRLPSRYDCERVSVKIGGRRVYLDVGRDRDGDVRSVFLDLAKTGDEVRAWAEVVSRMVSVMLQYDVPLEKITHMLRGTKFKPAGIVVGSGAIRFTTSPLDFVGRFLEGEEDAKQAQGHTVGQAGSGAGTAPAVT